MSDSKDFSNDAPMDDDIQSFLFSGLRPVPIDAAVYSLMLGRTLSRIRGASPLSFVTVRTGQGEWHEIVAGVFQKKLFESGKMHACLYRMLPGSSFPAHEHASDEECLCLEGEVNLGGMQIRAGDFHLAPKGLAHGEITTLEGCLLYIRCGAT